MWEILKQKSVLNFFSIATTALVSCLSTTLTNSSDLNTVPSEDATAADKNENSTESAEKALTNKNEATKSAKTVEEIYKRETVLIEYFLLENDSKFLTLLHEEKIDTCKALINDLKDRQTLGLHIPQNIKDIINSYKDGDIFNEYQQRGTIKQYYIDYQRKEEQDKNKNLTKVAIPSYPARAPSHPALRPPDHRDERMNGARRAGPSNSSRVSSKTQSNVRVTDVANPLMSRTPSHPAGIKPQTNLPQRKNETEKSLTGPGARDAVLKKGGIRPNDFESGDATRSKEEHLEKIGIRLAKLEFELSQTKISKGGLYKVKYRPDLGSHNLRSTKGYGNEASNKQKEIDTLTEDLLKNYSQDDIKKVYASKTKELAELNKAPKTAPRNVRGPGPLAGSDCHVR